MTDTRRVYRDIIPQPQPRWPTGWYVRPGGSLACHGCVQTITEQRGMGRELVRGCRCAVQVTEVRE